MMRKWLGLFAVIGSVLVVDQVTKQWILDSLVQGESRQLIPALSPYFEITRSHNTGSAFGFLPQAGDIFLLIAIVVVIAMVIFYPRIPTNAPATRLAIGLVCGGALGNALDRIELGYVVDFIHYTIPGVVSNVSNLADHAIVLGVIILFIDSWRLDRAKQQADGEQAADAAPPS